MKKERIESFLDSLLYDLCKIVFEVFLFLGHIFWHKKITIILSGKTIVIFVVSVTLVLFVVMVISKKDYW